MTEEEMRRRFALAHLQHLAQGGTAQPAQQLTPDQQKLVDMGIVGDVGINHIAGDVGHYIGKEIGAEPAYVAKDAAFNLPHLAQYQNAGTQGVNNAIGVQNQQGQLGRMLFSEANGGGPNLATQQLQNATDANIRQTMALNASSPSYAGVGAGNRNALTAAANIQQQAAGQAGQLRAEQQLGAQGQLSGLLAQQGQGALGLSTLGFGANNAQMQAQIDQQRINAGIAQNQQQAGASVIGGGLNGLGAYLGLARGGSVLPMLSGGGVPGHAAVAGDSGRNDTVPAMLSPGEVVLPRSVTEDEDAPHKAMMFVQAILAKKRARMS